MRIRSINIGALLFFSALFITGCYTRLMTPHEFVQSQRNLGVRNTPDNSFALNYNQSCVTCHSVDELNERSEEMDYYGIRSVHNGYLLSSRDWITVTISQPPVPNPSPNPYWPPVTNTGNSWWSPNGGTQTAPPPVDPTRSNGPTRDGSTERERPQGTTPPVYTQPQTPSSGTSTPPPTSTTTVTTQPAPTTPAGDSGRSREESAPVNSSGRTRGDSSTRDDETKRPR